MLVVDVQGRTLLERVIPVTGPGPLDLTWDGRDASGAAVASGRYFVRLVLGDQEEKASVTIVH